MKIETEIMPHNGLNALVLVPGSFVQPPALGDPVELAVRVAPEGTESMGFFLGSEVFETYGNIPDVILQSSPDPELRTRTEGVTWTAGPIQVLMVYVL